MNKLQSIKLRFFFWLAGTLDLAVFPDELQRLKMQAKDECLRQALAALEAIGQRQRGGSRQARTTHMFLTTQLQGVGVVL